MTPHLKQLRDALAAMTPGNWGAIQGALISTSIDGLPPECDKMLTNDDLRSLVILRNTLPALLPVIEQMAEALERVLATGERMRKARDKFECITMQCPEDDRDDEFCEAGAQMEEAVVAHVQATNDATAALAALELGREGK